MSSLTIQPTTANPPYGPLHEWVKIMQEVSMHGALVISSTDQVPQTLQVRLRSAIYFVAADLRELNGAGQLKYRNIIREQASNLLVNFDTQFCFTVEKKNCAIRANL